MNTEEIKWISFYGKDTGTVCRSFYEKVKKFGFCLVLDEYGSDKASKAQLSVLDAVFANSYPNILLICPKHLMHSWYRSLVTKDGMDFKMISGSSRAITYFNKDMSNTYIIAEEALRADNAMLEQFEQAGIVWDLMIIDAGLNIAGVDSSLYLEHIKTKTEKLVVFSPVPCAYGKGYDDIKSLVKGLMNDEQKAAAVDNIDFSKNTICFHPDVPVMRYYDTSVYSGETARNIVMLNYAFDNDFILSSRKLIDIKTGLPLYPCGGNIFEEYALEAKKVYTKPSYTMADVNILRETDKKLDCFLTKLDEVLGSATNKAVVYCVTSSTISYLTKVIKALYPNYANLLKVDRGDIFNTRYDNFTAEPSDSARVVITVDTIGSINPVMKTFTHIFNYELPNSPVVLEQRAARHGGKDEASREFILFCDDNGIFDSRMLSKVLFGKIYKSLVEGLPGRNVLFDLPNATQLVVSCIKDLQYVCGYTGEVASSRDVITQFIGDYNVIPSVDLSTAAKTHDYTAEKLDKIYRAFGIENQIKDNSTDEKALKQMIKPVIDSYKNSLLYLNENQRIIPISGEELKECLYGEQYNEYKQQAGSSEIGMGLTAARGALDNYISENKSAELRQCVNELPDVMKMPVLLNTWRYLTDEYIIQDTFREFMRNCNEGVM